MKLYMKEILKLVKLKKFMQIIMVILIHSFSTEYPLKEKLGELKRNPKSNKKCSGYKSFQLLTLNLP
jgi:hypothetical protein